MEEILMNELKASRHTGDTYAIVIGLLIAKLSDTPAERERFARMSLTQLVREAQKTHSYRQLKNKTESGWT